MGARGRFPKVRAIGVMFVRFVDGGTAVVVGRHVDVYRYVVGCFFVAVYVVCVRRYLGLRSVAMIPFRFELGVRLPKFKAAGRLQLHRSGKPERFVACFLDEREGEARRDSRSGGFAGQVLLRSRFNCQWLSLFLW